MANSYGDNLKSAQDKITLLDYNHAARLYTNNNLKFAPKTKFLYHCFFAIEPGVKDIAPTLTEKYGTEIGMLVKQADLPKFSATIETRKKYNRTKHVQTGIQYQPITISFHDDNHGVTTALLEAYYRWYYADGWHGSNAGAYSKSKGDNTYLGTARNQYRYGLDNNLSVPFFKNLQISQLARSQYTTYTLVNPIITNWEHDNLDNSDGSGMMQNTITLQYEAVHYSRGTVSIGADGEPTAFGTSHYDTYPSPIAPDPSLVTTTIETAELGVRTPRENRFELDEDAVRSSYPSTATNNAYINVSTVPDTNTLGGLANIIIPKSRGRGGAQNETISSASTIVTKRTTGEQSRLNAEDLQNDPARLDSLAKNLFKDDFLQNGGSGVNGLSVAWSNLPETEKESYRKLILDTAT